MNHAVLEKLYLFYHITAQTEYNPYSTDMSDALLRDGIIPHYGNRQGEQEDGFFVWTNIQQALQHAQLFARGNSSLITLKIPCNDVRYPTWKFDVEGLFFDPFLLNGLCAKHPDIATHVFNQADFQTEIQSVIGNSSLCLKQEPTTPCIALFDKNDDLFYVINELCGIMGFHIIDELERCYPCVHSEIQKISTALKTGEKLTDYPMLSSCTSFWEVWQNYDFQRCFLGRYQEQIRLLNKNDDFLASIAQRNPITKRLKRFQVCLATHKTKVYRQSGDDCFPLSCTDAGYEKILNGLLKRSFILQQEYNLLLRKRSENRGIGLMVHDIPYPEIGHYPLKYTGDDYLPIFCATRLKKDGMRMRAKEHPRQRG